MTVVDLFAGPGGWDVGARSLGVDPVGIEWDKAACQTRAAAGLLTIRADVAEYPTVPHVGLIASPPCQAFSMAGKGKGRDLVGVLAQSIWDRRGGWADLDAPLVADDVRADLTLQPVRWAADQRPEWVACEQVPPVLPLWQAFADVLDRWGYSTVCAVVNAADYGVPQTRRRAILLASRVRDVQLPAVTHHDPRKGGLLFGEQWVSMADALGWGWNEKPPVALDRRQERTEKDGTRAPVAPVAVDRPAPAVTGAGNHVWKIRAGAQANSADRDLSEPAPTIAFGNDSASWAWQRPATTVVGSFSPDIVAAPGWRTDISRQNEPDSIQVTVEEAGILQTFPADYPWQGPKTKRYEQVGNALPVLLAERLLGQVVGGG